MIGIFVMRRGGFHRQFVPVGVKFVGEHRTEGGEHALSHFGVGNDSGDPVVRGNLDPGVDQNFTVLGNQRRQLRHPVPGADRNTNHKNAAGHHARCQQSPP